MGPWSSGYDITLTIQIIRKVRVPGSKELFRENLGKEMKVLAGPLYIYGIPNKCLPLHFAKKHKI